MKKNKKAKLWKIIYLMTGGLAIIATPIITTACSSNNSSNNSGNNGGSGDSGGSSGTGGSEEDGSGSGGSDGGSSSQKKDVVFNASVDIVGAADKVFTNPKEGIEKVLNDNKKLVIKNYDEIQNYLSDAKIAIKINNDEKDLWGSKSYTEWNKDDVEGKLEKIYYPSKMSFLSISSKNNLHELLSKDLVTTIKTIDDKFSSITNATIVNDTNLGYEKEANLLHINIELTSSDNRNTKKYDLCLPTSDIDINIENLELSISGDKINNNKTKLNFIYDVGIDSYNNLIDYNKNIVFDVDKNSPTYDEILEKLGWETSGNLNDQKISESLGIYNVNFSKGEIKNNILSDELSPNKKELTIKATPINNYSWNDGTNEEKIITISNVGYLQKTGELRVESASWTVKPIPKEELQNPKDFVLKHKDEIIKNISNAGSIKPNLINVTLEYENYVFISNGSTEILKKGTLTLKPVAKPGFLLKDDHISKKMTIDLKLAEK